MTKVWSPSQSKNIFWPHSHKKWNIFDSPHMVNLSKMWTPIPSFCRLNLWSFLAPLHNATVFPLKIGPLKFCTYQNLIILFIIIHALTLFCQYLVCLLFEGSKMSMLTCLDSFDTFPLIFVYSFRKIFLRNFIFCAPILRRAGYMR